MPARFATSNTARACVCSPTGIRPITLSHAIVSCVTQGLLDFGVAVGAHVASIPERLLHRQRQPQIGAGVAPDADEPGRGNADDRGCHSADDDRLAEHVGAAETFLPQAIADDGDWLTIRDADVVRADRATMNDWDLEGGEVLAGHELRTNRLAAASVPEDGRRESPVRVIAASEPRLPSAACRRSKREYEKRM